MALLPALSDRPMARRTWRACARPRMRTIPARR
jgi:hypothetical protein